MIGFLNYYVLILPLCSQEEQLSGYLRDNKLLVREHISRLRRRTLRIVPPKPRCYSDKLQRARILPRIDATGPGRGFKRGLVTAKFNICGRAATTRPPVVAPMNLPPRRRHNFRGRNFSFRWGCACKHALSCSPLLSYISIRDSYHCESNRSDVIIFVSNDER